MHVIWTPPGFFSIFLVYILFFNDVLAHAFVAADMHQQLRNLQHTQCQKIFADTQNRLKCPTYIQLGLPHMHSKLQLSRGYERVPKFKSIVPLPLSVWD